VAYKVPQIVRLVQEIPRTGKIIRYKLGPRSLAAKILFLAWL
jgi:acyl-coenzyme A synthetase/AMP-(fatty) acid ligase